MEPHLHFPVLMKIHCNVVTNNCQVSSRRHKLNTVLKIIIPCDTSENLNKG